MPNPSGRTARSTPHAAFLFAFGCFGALHFLIYTFGYGFPILPSNALAGLAGLALACRPSSRISFGVLSAALLVDGVLQAPVFSNHTMLKNFFVVGTVIAAAEALMRREGWETFIDRLAITGRWLLLGMYVFGIFHKINTDFLDPASSCAVTLWQAMPFPAFVRDAPLLHIAGIWGTFIVEGLIVAFLLWPRARTLGIALGTAFHAMLALSGYDFYAPFSTLVIALHCLFLQPHALERACAHPQIRRLGAALTHPLGGALIAVYAVALGFLARAEAFSRFGLAWLLIPGGLLLALLLPAIQRAEAPATKAISLRPSWPAGILVLAFFANGFAPYFGLKTAQTFSMFANLRLEGDQPNHLILRHPPGPFQYLADPVRVIGADNAPRLEALARRELSVTRYDLLNQMERASENAAVTYQRPGEPPIRVTRPELRAAFDDQLHPRWFRAWFHFAPVNPLTPKPCAPDN